MAYKCAAAQCRDINIAAEIISSFAVMESWQNALNEAYRAAFSQSEARRQIRHWRTARIVLQQSIDKASQGATCIMHYSTRY